MSASLRNMSRLKQTVDAVLIAVLAFLTLPGTLLEHPSWVMASWVSLLLVPLWWRRTHPDVVMAILVAVGAVQLAVSDSAIEGNVTMLLALYSCARYGRVWRSAVWVVVVLAGSGVATYVWTRDEVGLVSPELLQRDIQSLAGALVALTLLSWMAGHLGRLDASLISVRTAAEVAAQEQEVRLAVAAERAQIGREVHDIMGHALALIAVQADAACYIIAASPREIDLSPDERLRQSEEALSNIRTHATAALEETRTLVRAIGEADSEKDIRHPLHGIDDIPELVDAVRSSGRVVKLDCENFDFGRIDTPTQSAIYRVVQESITNAIKHTRTAEINIHITYDSDLTVSVCTEKDSAENTTTTVKSSAEPLRRGRGLIGMNERVSALGGVLRAGPTPEGGFLVEARLPLQVNEHVTS
ncbi:Sensor protein degS [Dermatophilus congolensis]|uniref:histidine kinase n=1 Tax=Dermatophilus congolensis TaxID=1863 RepID=A0A239VI12_9MICO|nr:histidine kinase [Dermatophilus congolensis]SNV21911.1 Sensor protein degS [Dermatophilus congolensis]